MSGQPETTPANEQVAQPEAKAKPKASPIKPEVLSAMQQRAKLNEQMREKARKNRAVVGFPVDRGVSFSDLPYDQRQRWLRDHEQRWKQRMAEKQNSMYGESHMLNRG